MRIFIFMGEARGPKPVEPVSVSFGPATGPDWSLSVMEDDLGAMDPDVSRIDEPQIRRAPR